MFKFKEILIKVLFLFQKIIQFELKVKSKKLKVQTKNTPISWSVFLFGTRGGTHSAILSFYVFLFIIFIYFYLCLILTYFCSHAGAGKCSYPSHFLSPPVRVHAIFDCFAFRLTLVQKKHLAVFFGTRGGTHSAILYFYAFYLSYLFIFTYA